tara:strand:+ start:1103 stop:1567 length:465 start_codon:yes stop_codon:yes gene_type:complete
MAHFAKISEENIVLGINVLNDSDCQNEEGVETESVGQAFLEKCHNWPAHLWIKTSYNTYGNKHKSGDDSKAFRGNYAGIGFIWDSSNNVFIPPKPYPSWTRVTLGWIPPLEKPDLTTEQENQNSANTHHWEYQWNESAYQANNSTGWIAVDNLA